MYMYAPNGFIDKEVFEPIDVNFVAMFKPVPFDTRILVQHGSFSFHPDIRMPLKSEKLHSGYRKLGYEYDSNLVKIVIKSEAKEFISRKLDELGVNRKSLFPGLDGLSDYINWHTQHSSNLSKARAE